MQTLVLDQGYQPHRIIPWQRAVTMLFTDKVEVVEEYDEEIRSVSLTIKMPAVVRLLRSARPRKRGIRFSRVNVAIRDDHRCQYCGVKLPLRQLTFDHVVPRRLGGATSWTNIVMACRPCNGHKGGRTPDAAGMRLRKEPIKPTWLPVSTFRFEQARSLPEAWTQWLYWNGDLGAHFDA